MLNDLMKMTNVVLLLISMIVSLAVAYLSAGLLDYDLIDPYIYAITLFDLRDGFSYFFLLALYSPVPFAIWFIWQMRSVS